MKIKTFDLYIFLDNDKKVYYNISRVAVNRFVEYYDTEDYIIVMNDGDNNGQG